MHSGVTALTRFWLDGCNNGPTNGQTDEQIKRWMNTVFKNPAIIIFMLACHSFIE